MADERCVDESGSMTLNQCKRYRVHVDEMWCTDGRCSVYIWKRCRPHVAELRVLWERCRPGLTARCVLCLYEMQTRSDCKMCLVFVEGADRVRLKDVSCVCTRC